MEGWPSGLRRTPGKRVCEQSHRGFESRSLRHPTLFELRAASHKKTQAPNEVELGVSTEALARRWIGGQINKNIYDGERMGARVSPVSLKSPLGSMASSEGSKIDRKKPGVRAENGFTVTSGLSIVPCML